MKYFFMALLAALALCGSSTLTVSAHQPFFEETDLTYGNPYAVREPDVSLAYYATLDSPADVDYYAIEGEAGQQILVELTIPQIAGQENFAPYLAIIGPGFDTQIIPEQIQLPEQAGVKVFPPPSVARTFHEPFSGTSYWERQKEFVTLPERARYLLAVWHPQGSVGRYVFVTGTREVLGGDLSFPIKMRDYWTPVEPKALESSLLERFWQKLRAWNSGQ